ncbi:Disks large homolog 5 [Eumeta japonica]|uniref:Disks large homolog 5 n=1 Tax=Eumeta variegata TaxID=151549 RepID=A0A4C1UMN1_EUMVA|nr:Disks large homolog 5 [Eumeta japonica]
MVVDAVEKERVDNLEVANQELERLRKRVDRLQAELAEAHQEAEVSKRRRDWAFSERDKIVQERESIRTLCDRLRKERDRAVSDLAEALRDSDDIKKQRNEASKELKELKDKIESELEKEPPTNRSRHSTIDYEWDIIDVELNGLSKDGDLGFDLSGGREDPYYHNDYSIYVTSVQKGSVAEGKIKLVVFPAALRLFSDGPRCVFSERGRGGI